MKIKTLISVFILSLLITTVPIFAKNEATTTPRTIRNQIKEERQEAKITITEAKQKRIQSIYNTLKNGLEKRHAALLKIKDKIQARIDKNPMNKDTTTAKAEMIKFVAAEAKYQTDLAILETKFIELKSSTQASDLVQGLKDSVKLVREDLNAIKKVLTTTVKALAQAPKLEVTKTQ
jgi:hypothetical protein